MPGTYFVYKVGTTTYHSMFPVVNEEKTPPCMDFNRSFNSFVFFLFDGETSSLRGTRFSPLLTENVSWQPWKGATRKVSIEMSWCLYRLDIWRPSIERRKKLYSTVTLVDLAGNFFNVPCIWLSRIMRVVGNHATWSLVEKSNLGPNRNSSRRWGASR